MALQRLPLLIRRLKELREGFFEACKSDVPGLLAARTYARNFLENLRKAFADETFSNGGWSLVAVGGFGRGELSFASDVDILFLYQHRLPQVLQEVVRELVYGLWDGGFEVGHATASLSAVKRLAREDFSALTNQLEAQLIAGDKTLFDSWRAAMRKDFGIMSRKRFLSELLSYRNGRIHQYGESSYLLEPHVKEGVGGLRDLQIIRWTGMVYLFDTSIEASIRKGWLTSEEELWLEHAYDFLWRVRLQLHQLTGRRQDQLLLPEQEEVAFRLGFLNGDQGSAVEAFMRLYYRHTARISRTASFFLERVGEAQRKLPRVRVRKRILPGPFLLDGRRLHFLEPEWVKKDPRLLMRFFWQAAKSNAHFHHQTGHVIRENLQAFTDSARRDPEVVKQFMDILLDHKNAFSVLSTMLETRFLETFIPEFAAVRYRVQYDVYHLYTVDEHLLKTVRELHLMEQGADDTLLPFGLKDIFVQLEHRRILYLAGLLHDIGKGHGKNHSARGAAMARDVANQFRLDATETDLLCFLIEKHLILADTALKRDLMDEKPILRCAIDVGDRERLAMLYLLTIADSRATGPGAWSTWKASLLRELYMRVDRVLLRGDWEPEDLQKHSEETQQAVLALVDTESGKSEVSKWLEGLSFRYLVSQSPEAILSHYLLERKLAEAPLVCQTRKAEGEMWQVTVSTHDRPGLFATITGVLWARGLNILSADIFTRTTGIVMDIIIVERLPDPLHPAELWEKIERDLCESLKSRSYLTDLLSDKRKPSLLHSKGLPRKEDRVLINEEASDFYTIVEVYTWDRPGVLHAITNTFFELSISIQLAKISTPGAQVADVFYVTDMSGNKLMDPEMHASVTNKLLECLSSES